MSEKLAVVTGTSSGIGEAVARLLLDGGWNVVGLSRRSAGIADDRYRHLTIDLGESGALDRLLAEDIERLVGESRWRRVGLVNNAAQADLLNPVERLRADRLAASHRVNLVAPVAMMAAISRAVPKNTELRIVNVSSGAATHAFPGLGAYCSAKAGLRMAGMVLAAEWESTVAHAPTRTNAALLSYEPGVVDTAMQTTARNQPDADFPWVGIFRDFQAKGVIVPASRPAGEIVQFLESDGRTGFSELRLGA